MFSFYFFKRFIENHFLPQLVPTLRHKYIETTQIILFVGIYSKFSNEIFILFVTVILIVNFVTKGTQRTQSSSLRPQRLTK